MQPEAATTSVYELLESVTDPEIPVLSIRDLGILRAVEQLGPNNVRVVITPTYSGCPAMDTIEADIKSTLQEAGWQVEVKTQIAPAWTTDWMSEAGRRKLEAYGIAPPAESTADKAAILGKEKSVKCPQCKSKNTALISQFGSTACKALYKCQECLEVFDYFKCI